MEINYKAWFDGGCNPNPGGYAYYGALITKDSETVWEGSGLVITDTQTSNNLAEYAGYVAVLMALEKLKLREQSVMIYGDSKMVIEQMKGVMKIKTGLYSPLAHKAKQLTESFPRIELVWIPREENSLADSLASQALFQEGLICVPCFDDDNQYEFCSCRCHKIDLRN